MAITLNDKLFQFALLRYIHSPETQEFINVGVVVFSWEAGFVKAKMNKSPERAQRTWKGVKGDCYTQILEFIENRINTELRPAPMSLRGWLSAFVMAEDDSSLVFGGFGGGASDNLDETLERLYNNLVVKYL